MQVRFNAVSPRARRSAGESRTAATRILVGAACLCTGLAGTAHAQSWSGGRTQPLLRQIVSVDATGEAVWAYGREDIAGDGLAVFQADEAGTDLRTVYAEADAQRLWLRAYVASESTPPSELVAFFFADTDNRNDTGGPATGQALWPAWHTDPTPGGYDRALGLRGDGTLLGVWSWDATTAGWTALRPRKDDVHVELGHDQDPIRIGVLEHGYFQADVIDGLTGLTASCAGNLFVRVWHDAPAPRSFGDDDPEAFACRPSVDVYGDPPVLHSVACHTDQDCPNAGQCRNGVCLFAYACATDADCASGERCTANACVRVVTTTCSGNADCQGLVCENAACVACGSNGVSCANGLTCSPNGSCVDVTNGVPTGNGTGTGTGSGTGSNTGSDAGASGAAGDTNPDAGLVRGGAFHCAAVPPIDGVRGWSPWFWALAGAWLARRRSRRERALERRAA